MVMESFTLPAFVWPHLLCQCSVALQEGVCSLCSEGEGEGVQVWVMDGHVHAWASDIYAQRRSAVITIINYNYDILQL